MRKILFFVFAYLGVALLACQDGKEAYKNPIADLEFLKNVGKKIPNETGHRWLALYQERAQKSGRSIDTPYNITAEQLQAMLASVEGLTGVAFHHGLDAAGEHHFIIVPVNETLSVWSDISGRAYIDANTNSEISQETARAWAAAYEEAHPSEVWFHYFGRTVFDEIQKIPYFSNLEIEPAISDVDFTPQLLLIVLDENAVSTTGRSETMDDGETVYDASSPCPPCAVQ